MAKDKEQKKVELEHELGKLSYALSVQGEVLQREKEKFDVLQKKGNDLVTELKEWQKK